MSKRAPTYDSKESHVMHLGWASTRNKEVAWIMSSDATRRYDDYWNRNFGSIYKLNAYWIDYEQAWWKICDALWPKNKKV